MDITIKTQAEWDALPAKYDSPTRIVVTGKITISKVPKSAHVEARESAHVVARGSAHVVARGSAHVEARGNVALRIHSSACEVALMGFAVAWTFAKVKFSRRSKTSHVIEPRLPKNTDEWLEAEGVAEKQAKTVTVFKRVSAEFQTQEGTSNETLWKVGSTVTHKKWDPESKECGEGKFHACSTPYFCDEFRHERGDRYIAIAVARKDLFAWPKAQYPHKVAFRKGVVLHEVNRFGKKVEAAK